MASKHVVNEPTAAVDEALAGLARTNPNIAVDPAYRVVHLQNPPQDRVALISGGGSGHEPAHAGFVGEGLLTASACGNIFASPNVGQVRRAIELSSNPKGTLSIIMRYTGDVLLFGLAKEQQSVTNPSVPCRLTVVGDDCAVPRSQGKLVGRRGLAGTILSYKAAAAKAAQGKDIDAVQDVAEAVAGMCGTIGAGLDHCHIPGTAKGESFLDETEVEIGMGIHNEAGIEKVKLASSKELIKRMLNFVIDTTDKERAFLPFKHDGKDEVVLMVNNLGGMSELEMSLISDDAVQCLEGQGISVVRILCGSFITSLNLPGFSLTCLLLPRAGGKYSSSDILSLLDAPASAPGWSSTTCVAPGKPKPATAPAPPQVRKSGGESVKPTDGKLMLSALTSACEAAVKAEPEITRFDTIAGDGDAGLCLKAGASGVLAAIRDGSVSDSDVVSAVLAVAQVVERDMDGTSGALYSIWTNALAGGLIATGKQTATPDVWASALSHALKTLFDYTAARRPSRTLVDPLQAFTDAFAANPNDFASAVQAAAVASDETKKLVAKAGRAAYVAQEALKNADIPDPGAHGVVQILQGIQKALA